MRRKGKGSERRRCGEGREEERDLEVNRREEREEKVEERKKLGEDEKRREGERRGGGVIAAFKPRGHRIWLFTRE